jgi:hypothetical protein
MPDLPRAMVDDAVRRYFEDVGLDLERTREAVAQTVARKAAEAQAFRDAAEQTVARVEAQIARAERDYLAERLDADRWQRLDSRLSEELNAARAEADQFASREREARALADMGDIEADMLRHLAHLRKVVAGEVRDAETLDALRLALMRLFEGFTVHALGVENIAATPRYWQPELLVPGFYIEPHPRPSAILSAAPKGFDDQIIFPVLRREELPAPQQTTAYAGLAMMSSPPRSSIRMRCSSSASGLRTMIGVSGSTRPAKPSPERTASSRSSVRPSMSAMIRSGCSTDSRAIALARVSAALTR